MHGGMHPDEAMIAAVRRLREAHVPVPLVTNPFGAHCYDGYHLDTLADAVVRSGVLGVRKSWRRIVATACERIGVEPARPALADDVDRNISGAARKGIRGVLHVSADETIPTLAALFGVPPDEPVGTASSFDQGDTR